MNVIEIINLTKKFGNNVILDEINIAIPERKIYGIVGISGAGKSTLLRCINGLEPFQSGDLFVDGVSLKNLHGNELRKFQREIGMVFQQFSLIERSNVYDNIAFPMRCWGYKKSEIDDKVKYLLNIVELEDKMFSMPRELSGGQKQRVAIARALSLDPKILLCDEATSALDPNITISILNLLQSINEKLGVTIVIVTHEMEVIKQICDNISILSHGKLEAEGDVEGIFLKKPPVLQEVIGLTEINNPIEGINIELFLDAKEQKEILSDMAIKTQVKYSIYYGGYDDFKDSVKGSFLINFDAEDYDRIKAYLNENSVEWREI